MNAVKDRVAWVSALARPDTNAPVEIVFSFTAPCGSQVRLKMGPIDNMDPGTAERLNAHDGCLVKMEIVRVQKGKR